MDLFYENTLRSSLWTFPFELLANLEARKTTSNRIFALRSICVCMSESVCVCVCVGDVVELYIHFVSLSRSREHITHQAANHTEEQRECIVWLLVHHHHFAGTSRTRKVLWFGVYCRFSDPFSSSQSKDSVDEQQEQLWNVFHIVVTKSVCMRDNEQTQT